MRIASALVAVAVTLACSPPSPGLTVTFPDATTLRYQPLDGAGAATALSLLPNENPARSTWKQVFSAPGDDPRAGAVSVSVGRWDAAHGTPLFAMGINVEVALGSDDMEPVAFATTFDDVHWTGDPTSPYVFSGEGENAQGGRVTAVVGPRCAKDGASSNYGCGFVPPDGTTSGTVSFASKPTMTFAGMSDGCSGNTWYADAASGEPWTWTGDKLVFASGRTLDCLTTGSGGVVCHDFRQVNVTKDINGFDCGWGVTTLAYPDVSGSPSESHPRLWVLASANDQSVTTGCYGFTWCTGGF